MNEKKGIGLRIIGIAILVVVFLFFLTLSMTGNVIGSLNASVFNLLGIFLFVIGLFVVYFSFRKK